MRAKRRGQPKKTHRRRAARARDALNRTKDNLPSAPIPPPSPADGVSPAPIVSGPAFVDRLLLPYSLPARPDHPGWNRDATAGIIREYEAAFADTKSPLYAWCAYLHARAASLDVPEWVFAYLDSVAEKIWATRPSGRWRKDAARIAEALGHNTAISFRVPWLGLD